MNEIEIGTPVYHVEEYRLSNYELKQKGFEGFNNYGLEVVESVVIAVTDTHFDAITEKRDIGSNTNNMHCWARSELGRSVFLSKEEAAEEADNRAHNIQLGYLTVQSLASAQCTRIGYIGRMQPRQRHLKSKQVIDQTLLQKKLRFQRSFTLPGGMES